MHNNITIKKNQFADHNLCFRESAANFYFIYIHIIKIKLILSPFIPIFHYIFSYNK